MGANLLTQQLAPPTPSNASHAAPMPTNPQVSHYTPHQSRRPSSNSSAPNSPYYNFAAVRTSLPAISPNSYSSSPSYGYSPTAGAEAGYFPTYQPPQQPTSTAYPSPYAANARPSTSKSESMRELTRPTRLEGLHLPPIRTGPPPLGSPLHIETSSGTQERERVRPRDSSLSGPERRGPESPDAGKRRRLNIREMLE